MERERGDYVLDFRKLEMSTSDIRNLAISASILCPGSIGSALLRMIYVLGLDSSGENERNIPVGDFFIHVQIGRPIRYVKYAGISLFLDVIPRRLRDLIAPAEISVAEAITLGQMANIRISQLLSFEPDASMGRYKSDIRRYIGSLLQPNESVIDFLSRIESDSMEKQWVYYVTDDVALVTNMSPGMRIVLSGLPSMQAMVFINYEIMPTFMASHYGINGAKLYRSADGKKYVISKSGMQYKILNFDPESITLSEK